MKRFFVLRILFFIALGFLAALSSASSLKQTVQSRLLRSAIEHAGKKLRVPSKQTLTPFVSLIHSAASRAQTSSSRPVRVLQSGLPSEYEVLDELIDFIAEKCTEEFLALNLTAPETEPVVNVILCVKDAFIDVVDPCFERFPGVWDPVHCTIETLFSRDFLTALVDFIISFDFSGGGSISDPLDLLNGDLLAFLNATLSLDNIESVFAPLDGLDAPTCETLFGTAAQPQFISCLCLLKSSDLEKFVLALSTGFSGVPQCTQFRSLFGIEVDQLFTPDELEYELGFDLTDIDETVVDQFFAGFNTNFGTCSEIDNKALENSLEGKFATPPAAEGEEGAANLIVAQTLVTGVITVVVALKLLA